MSMTRGIKPKSMSSKKNFQSHDQASLTKKSASSLPKNQGFSVKTMGSISSK